MAAAKKGGTSKGKPRRQSKASVAPKRVRRSREDISSRIVAAATDEFNRCGYFATTTAAVAAKAGVTEAQVFRYYRSKANLFRETIFNPLNLHLKNFLAAHLPDGGADSDSRLYTTELQQFISEHSGALTSLIFAETYDDGSNVGVSEIDSLQTYFKRGATTMRERAQHEHQVDPDLFVRISFVTVLACILFKPWIFPRGVASAEAIRTGIADFVAIALEGNLEQKPRT